MTPEQTKALLVAVEKVEEFLKGVRVGVEMQDSPLRRWYTPTNLTLRLLRIGAQVAPMEGQFILGCLHGCIDIFGFAGTAKLALELRKVVNARKQKHKKNAVS